MFCQIRSFVRALTKGGRAFGIIALSLALILPLLIPSRALSQTTAAQLQRAEDITQQEISLRKKLEQDGKVFVKKILVKGASLISKDNIEQIISPFKKHWLTPNDIQQIIEEIKQAYQQSGFAGQPVKIGYQLKRNNLKILIEELTQSSNQKEKGDKK